jgi:hypothetical protein
MLARYSGKLGSFDEMGLANALVGLGSDQGRIVTALRRLSRNHSSDADDVARYYIRLMIEGGKKSQLQRMGTVVTQLLSIMEDGWVSGEDHQWIEALRQH